MTDTDLIAPGIAQLIALFSEHAGLKFPDVDAPALTAAVARVKDRQLALAKLEAEAQFARAQLDDEQETLLKKALRAHAYLKVFSETQPELAEQVGALVLPRPRRSAARLDAEATSAAAASSHDPAAPRKRGRPPKARPDEVSLFGPASPTEQAPAEG